MHAVHPSTEALTRVPSFSLTSTFAEKKDEKDEESMETITPERLRQTRVTSAAMNTVTRKKAVIISITDKLPT
jgi:hypothetical protein